MSKTASDYLCVYCWPASVVAAWWDVHELPCCEACLEQPQRKPGCPSFVIDHIRAWSTFYVVKDEAA